MNETAIAPTPSPTATPETQSMRVARLEDEFQRTEDDDNKLRAEVRQAAVEYVRAKLPKWTIKGLSSQPYQANIFWVDVDLQSANQTAVISLSARKFFPEAGNGYWRVTLLDKSLVDKLHELDDASLLKEQNAAKSPP